MTQLFYRLLTATAFLGLTLHNAAANNDAKPRIVVLTDIAPGDTEPDDNESLVRLLAHADLYEIEALIPTSGWNNSGREYPKEWEQYMTAVIDAYEKDLPNLMKRSGQTGFLSLDKENGKQTIGYWPSAEYVRSRMISGSKNLGIKYLGSGNDSPGSDFIIELANENDNRPLWILAWGGGNTVAQALWKVKNSGNQRALDKLVDKLRIYTITDQDVDWGRRGQYDISSHKWMRTTFGDKLFFIWDESAWLSQNGIGASNWSEYEKYIQGKGHLGKAYPRYKWGVEGDTPSFLYVTPNGLDNSESPSDISWGGYFKKMLSDDSTTVCHTNTRPDIKKISQKYENYFYPAIFNNFAARMAWAEQGKGNRNPEVVVNGKKGLSPVEISAKSGQTINLDASKSSDPDGDRIDIKWLYLPEAGNGPTELDIAGDDTLKAELTVPRLPSGTKIHILCEATDNGDFNLKGYRRVIITVK